ncbi:MAG: squalene/phytoene synthase family protein, partial [Rhodospirillaceae bacterium]
MARRDTNFYYSFVVLPEHKRRAIIAVWDFCRAVDDDVDERAGQLGTEESRRAAAASLAGWRGELAACYEGGRPRTPQGLALAPHVAAFKLPRKPFEDVIDGVEMDLGRPRFGTFAELRDYCLRVASAVGLVCIEIFEYTDPRCREYAVDLGIALQLTNI